jgi:hypothetical protein
MKLKYFFILFIRLFIVVGFLMTIIYLLALATKLIIGSNLMIIAGICLYVVCVGLIVIFLEVAKDFWVFLCKFIRRMFNLYD